MNKTVRILQNDDGDEIHSPYWCLVVQPDGADRTLCTGEAFGAGESSVVFIERLTKKGGITCPKCLSIIKYYKSIKL